MQIEVRLPELGESTTHARLSIWLKKIGEPVSRGEIIAEVETDKTSVEIESPAAGVLASIQVPAGTEKVAIHQILALLEESSQPSSAASPEPDGAAVTSAAAAGAQVDRPATAVPFPPQPVSEQPASHAPLLPEGGHLLASPLARRMAAAAGLSLAAVRGSGIGGRVMRSDVEALLVPVAPSASASSAPAQGVALSAVPAAVRPIDDQARYTLTPLSTMRRVSAERLTRSKQQIPHFYLRVECAVDGMAKARNDINAKRPDPLSFTAFTLRAAALALRRVPAANATWADGALRIYEGVDLAVAVNTPSGLIAPVVRSAEGKSVVAINTEIRALAEKARLGKLKPEDYTGGTCTVSNLGMFGVTSLYPIINPPQTCILGIGAIEERPVVREHVVAVGLMMTCTLAADHRALDGATGAEFLAAFRELIEDPWALLL